MARAILPGLTHYNILSSPALPGTVTPFLDSNSPCLNDSTQMSVGVPT